MKINRGVGCRMGKNNIGNGENSILRIKSVIHNKSWGLIKNE